MRLFKRLKLALITAAVSVGAPAALSVNVNDGVGVLDAATSVVDYGVQLDDDVGVTEGITPQITPYEISVSDGVGVHDTDFSTTLGWFGVSSAHIDSFCGEEEATTLADGLDGTVRWEHWENHTHWFIIDLGATYNVRKVRGRSNYGDYDPTDVDIYVSDDKENWGAAVQEEITTWQDTTSWVEIDTTDKDGRYVKVEILSTENISNSLTFGDVPPFTIFDVFVVGVDTLEVNVSDGVGIADDVEAVIAYLVELDDDIGVADVAIVEIPILEISVDDDVGIATATTPLFNLYLVYIDDDIGVATYTLPQIPILEINVDDDVGILGTVTPIVDYGIYLDDDIGIADVPTVVVDYGIYTDDDVGITEDVAVEIPILEVSVDDDVGIVSVDTLKQVHGLITYDDIGITSIDTLNQAHGLVVYDDVGIATYTLPQIKILEIAIDDDIGLVDWRYYIIPDAIPTLTKDLFRFPRLPEDASDEMKVFLTDLESSLRTVLTGDYYVGGRINADGCKFGDVNNYVNVTSDGVTTWHGRGRVVNHVTLFPAAFKLHGANAAAVNDDGNFITLDFADGAEKDIYASHFVPFRWDASTDITVKIDWVCDADASAKAVAWNVKYTSIKDGEEVGVAGTTLTQAFTGRTAGLLRRSTFTTKIVKANIASDDDIGIKVFREVNGTGDTLDATARLIAVHLHFIRNAIGEAV